MLVISVISRRELRVAVHLQSHTHDGLGRFGRQTLTQYAAEIIAKLCALALGVWNQTTIPTSWALRRSTSAR